MISGQLENAAEMLQTTAFQGQPQEGQFRTAEGLASNIITTIANSTIRIQDAAALHSKVASMPVLSPEQKNRIMQAISLRVLAQPATTGEGQYVPNPLELLTAKDWEKLEAATALAIAMLIVCQRFNRLGLSAPTEKCCESLAAIAAMMWWKETMPTPGEAYQLCMDVKGWLRKTPLTGPRGPMTYPVDAAHIDPLLLTHAYPDIDGAPDPPISRMSGRYYTMRAHMVLRKSHNGLKTGASSNVLSMVSAKAGASHPALGTAVPPMMNGADVLSSFMAAVPMMMQQMGWSMPMHGMHVPPMQVPGASGAGSPINLTMLAPRKATGAPPTSVPPTSPLVPAIANGSPGATAPGTDATIPGALPGAIMTGDPETESHSVILGIAPPCNRSFIA